MAVPVGPCQRAARFAQMTRSERTSKRRTSGLVSGISARSFFATALPPRGPGARLASRGPAARASRVVANRSTTGLHIRPSRSLAWPARTLLQSPNDSRRRRPTSQAVFHGRIGEEERKFGRIGERTSHQPTAGGRVIQPPLFAKRAEFTGRTVNFVGRQPGGRDLVVQRPREHLLGELRLRRERDFRRNLRFAAPCCRPIPRGK